MNGLSLLVQSQCIPKALMKGDILCQARSGMGKTCVCHFHSSEHRAFGPCNLNDVVRE